MQDFSLEKVDDGFSDFLKDESKKTGSASSISFPLTEAEVAATLSYMSSSGVKVTVQGSRTGVAAGAVPREGHILNLGRMDRVTGMSFDACTGSFCITLQPGVILSKLREMIENKDFDTYGWSPESLKALDLFKKSGEWFFPTDPTESSVTLGGMAACNSSGACSYHYGPVRKYICGLNVVLADGSILDLTRWGDGSLEKSFSITSREGKLFYGEFPNYRMPDVKNASGYYVQEGMDLLDLFIGSEGTLGVITGMTLKLIPKPACVWGLTAFFAEEAQALSFVKTLRESSGGYMEASGAFTAALEYFNHDSLELLSRFKQERASFSSIHNIPDGVTSAVYMEIHALNEDAAGDLVLKATEILEECGGNSDNTWFADSEAAMENLHIFRHAVPEAVNMIIAERKRKEPGLTKLGTDMAVPDCRLEEVMDMYNHDLQDAGLESVIFGHIGNNHLHVNILPRSIEEYEAGWKLYHSWAERVIGMGGTISAEHGVGKLKTSLLERMYGRKGIDQMKAVKKVFDPLAILSPGNLFQSQ